VWIDEWPEFAELPEALPPLHAWGEAITGTRPDEGFSCIAGQSGRAKPDEEIPE
jgi:hypothetical protein